MNHPAHKRRPSRTSLIVVPGCLLAALLASTAVMLARDRSTVLENVITAQSNMALSLERDIVRNIDIYDLSLRAAASGLQLVDGTQDRTVQQAILFDGASAAQHFRPIILTDETGAVRHDSGSPQPRFASVAHRDYFQRQKAQSGLGLLMTLEPVNRTTGEPFLSLSRRIDRPDGQFAGTVSGGFSLDYFRGIFSQFRLPEHGAIALVGYDGRLIAGVPSRDDKVGQDVTKAGLVDQARAMPDGSFETTSVLDGVTRIATIRRLGQQPFFLAIGTPIDIVYAEWRVRAWLVGATMLAFIIASAILLLTLRRELERRWTAEQSALAATDEARLSEARFQTYIHHLADGILAISRRADGHFVYERINAAAARMLDIRAADVIGRRPSEVWPAPLAEDAESRWREAAAGGEPIRFERVLERAGGRRVLRFVLSPVREAGADGAGTVELLLASVRDVTDSVAMEDQLRQAQRLEVVGQLTAGVAHDFNNMLQIQFGALELLQDEVEDRPRAAECVGMMLGASRHGSRLTHSLLAFSRQQHLDPKPVDMQSRLAGISQMLGYTLGPRVMLEVTCTPGPGAPFADAVQLEAAILNLALNARDAMPRGGRLTITACDGVGGTAPPDGIDAREHYLVTVSDEGHGMSAETAARACEPFFTTKPVGKGSGLGLSMVQGFVQQSGGAMHIRSAPGEGTRIELWLPRIGTAEPGSLAPGPAQALALDNGWRILLVDDTADVLTITAELLEEAGFEVAQARHGEEALQLLASEPRFDALVTDYMMPGIDGGELVRLAHRTTPDLPAILVTGFADFDGLRDLPPNVHVVRKPIGGTALAAHIRNAIVHHRRPAEV